MTINTNNTISNFVTQYQNKSKEHTTSEKVEITATPNDQFDIQYQRGLDRYNSGFIKPFLEDSIFEKDENLKQAFIKHLDGMSEEAFAGLTITFWSDFHPQLERNANGEVTATGKPNYNAKEEFTSLDSIKNYFQKVIDDLLEAEKFGGSTEYARGVIGDILSVFTAYQLKEQEDAYVALGQNQKNNR